NVHARLVEAASLPLKDWFGFQVEQPLPIGQPSERFHVRALLDGRQFESFHVDVGVGDPMLEKPEKLSMPPLLEFAGIAPAVAPCFPVAQQIAEKVHAYTRPRSGREPSRVKDLVDILLLGSLSSVRGARLREALQATFEARRTHELPSALPTPPASWSTPFRKLANETGLAWTTLDEAYEACRRFLDPVLAENKRGKWNSAKWKWENL
ncbi:MAG: nucleotidyl transferase AbiEii/AbiGii toxin family protein, partial [Chloroflexota bacterium]